MVAKCKSLLADILTHFYDWLIVWKFRNVSTFCNALISNASRLECERSLYTDCVIKLATRRNLIDKCDATDLTNCLTNHLSKPICSVNDVDTIPTIEILIRDISRRFKRPGRCGNKRLLQKIKEHFKGE